MTLDLPRYTLNDGHSLPVIGFGTYPLRGQDGVEAMVHALEAGYQLLDSAVNYGNEEEVGEAVRRSGLAREDVQVTTKIPGRHHEYDQAIESVEESLRRMRFDYLDLVLIHWPNPAIGKYVEGWRALVELRERGVVRSIGVSNFTEQHLRAVIEDSGVTPAVKSDRAAPVLSSAADAGCARRPWHPDRGMESARQTQRAVRRPAGRRAGGAVRRDPGAGDPAMAVAAGVVAAAQVRDAAAAAAEPRSLRVRAHPRRSGRHHGAGPT